MLSQSLKTLVGHNNLTREYKITLLKIKLDYLINGDHNFERKFLLQVILTITIALCFSGIGGLALFLDPFRRLLKEGRISDAFYQEILKMVASRLLKGKTPPMDDFFD